jgi:hypothetical protein
MTSQSQILGGGPEERKSMNDRCEQWIANERRECRNDENDGDAQ